MMLLGGAAAWSADSMNTLGKTMLRSAVRSRQWPGGVLTSWLRQSKRSFLLHTRHFRLHFHRYERAVYDLRNLCFWREERLLATLCSLQDSVLV